MPDMRLAEFDISQIPVAEDDEFEFKSSQIPQNKLNDRLNEAASGFSNSGGGFFIVGIDNGTGDVDGGISRKMGKQDLRDWVDNVIHNVQPVPKYEVTLLDDIQGRGNLNNDSVILVVYFHESYIGPHMAHDNRYYIRAGAHTVPAKHFIVDAIWSKRHFSKPRLIHLFRFKPDKPEAIQLGIISVTNAVAVDVELNLSPAPKLIRNTPFPLKVSLINQDNPFFFDVAFYAGSKDWFGEDVSLGVTYYDLSGNEYRYEKELNISEAISPIDIGNNYLEKIASSLDSIQKKLDVFQSSRELPPNTVSILTTPPLSVIKEIDTLIPELFNQFRADVNQSPLVREFILINKGAIYNGRSDNEIFEYYYETHDHLRSKLRILENHALIREITFNSVPRFILSEELVSYLQTTSDQCVDKDEDLA
jgi:Putative DNA-binding domain